MKKRMIKIIVLIFIIAVICQHKCYAYRVKTTQFDLLSIISRFLIFIFIILVILLLIYLVLKIVGRIKKNKKEYNKLKNAIYILGVSTSIIYSTIMLFAEELLLVLPILIATILSIILKSKKENELAYIVLAIAVIVPSYLTLKPIAKDMLIEVYNKKFEKYEVNGALTDVEGLINTTISNNKFGRKTTIKYFEKEYTTPEELQTLLSKINTKGSYSVEFNGDKIIISQLADVDYITYIEIIDRVDYSLMDLRKYAGLCYNKQQVYRVIDTAVEKMEKRRYDTDLEIEILFQNFSVKLKNNDIKKEKDIIDAEIQSLKEAIKNNVYVIKWIPVSYNKIIIEIIEN